MVLNQKALAAFIAICLAIIETSIARRRSYINNMYSIITDQLILLISRLFIQRIIAALQKIWHKTRTKGYTYFGMCQCQAKYVSVVLGQSSCNDHIIAHLRSLLRLDLLYFLTPICHERDKERNIRSMYESIKYVTVSNAWSFTTFSALLMRTIALCSSEAVFMFNISFFVIFLMVAVKIC